MDKTCRKCGKLFTVRSNNEINCKECNTKKCEYCGKEFSKKYGAYWQWEKRKYCSVKCQSSAFSENFRHTEETKNKLSLMKYGKSTEWNKGDKCNFWKGGVYKLHRREKDKIMHTIEYKRWRKSVLLRDGKCMECGSKENLETHHIKSFAEFPELRTDIDNGITLCHDCHKKTDTYGKKLIT